MYLCIIQLSQQPTQGKYFYHPHFIAKKTETWEVKKFEQGHRANRSRGPPGYDTHALYNTLKQLLPRNGDSELTGNVWVLLSSKLCQARNIKWNFATDSDECPFFFYIYLFIWLLSVLVAEKAMAPHSRTLAWKIPRTEEPGRLQSMGSLRVGQDWVT